ncbi:hypothetical protein K2X92_05565 [Candidatus Gracilibacteria bacterium]|nr:hypothetical protein [Candidatus Gracilibacteria bacterium]
MNDTTKKNTGNGFVNLRDFKDTSMYTKISNEIKKDPIEPIKGDDKKKKRMA